MKHGVVVLALALVVGAASWMQASLAGRTRGGAPPAHNGSHTPAAADRTAATDSTSRTAGDPARILDELVELCDRQPYPRTEVLACCNRLRRHADACPALASYLLAKPAVTRSSVVRGVLRLLLEDLGTAAGVDVYIRAFGAFDSALQASGNSGDGSRGLIEGTSLLGYGISKKAARDHVTLLISTYGTLSVTRVRYALLSAIGVVYLRTGDRDLLAFLLAQLQTESDKSLRELIARALSRTADQHMVPDLLQRIAAESLIAGSKSANEAQFLAEGVIRLLRSPEALILLEAVVAGGHNDAVAQGVGRAIADAFDHGLLDANAVQFLAEQLAVTVDDKVQVMVLAAIKDAKTPDPRLMDALRGLTPAILAPGAHSQLLLAYSAHGQASEMWTVGEAAMRSGSTKVQAAAATAMVYFSYCHPEDSTVRDGLVALVQEGRAETRIEVISRLTRFSFTTPDLYRDVLLQLSREDPDPRVRAAAADTLRMNEQMENGK